MSKSKVICLVALIMIIFVVSPAKESTNVAQPTYSAPEMTIQELKIVVEHITVEEEPVYEEPVPTIPLYDVPLSQELQEYTYELCETYDIGEYFDLILAVMGHESTYKATVISKSKDYGLMQINKCNHKWLSEELGITNYLDEEQNILAGVYLLSSHLDKYKDIDKALMVYNMGPTVAKRAWAKGTYTTNYTRAVRKQLELVQTSKLQ